MKRVADMTLTEIIEHYTPASIKAIINEHERGDEDHEHHQREITED